MKATRIHSFGSSNVLTLEDAPRPEPGDGQVLIKVHAAGVNPVDWKIRSGQFKKAEMRFPFTPGRDVSGVVEAVGRGVAGFKPGDEVYAFLGSHSGGYAEYALAEETETALKPRSLDHVHAAAVPLAATTAWQALFEHGNLQPGQRLLIHGAAGGVGHYALQFAKAKGATVIATGRSEDMDFLRSLGADEVIDYRKARFEERARDVDFVLDLVGGETQERSWECLKDGGTLISTLEQPSQEKAGEHHAKATAMMAEPKAEQLREITHLIEQGKVKVVIEETFPLSEAKQAHDAIERRHTQGKIVLTV